MRFHFGTQTINFVTGIFIPEITPSPENPTDDEGPIAYSPYIENLHARLLGTDDIPALSAVGATNIVLNEGPEDIFDYTNNVNQLYLNNNYITKYASLYSFFDEDLSSVPLLGYRSWVERISLDDNSLCVVTKDGVDIQDTLDKKALQDLSSFIREHQLTHSSTFIVGKAVIETKKVSLLSSIDSECKKSLLHRAKEMDKMVRLWKILSMQQYGVLVRDYVENYMLHTEKKLRNQVGEVEYYMRTLQSLATIFPPDGAARHTISPRATVYNTIISNLRIAYQTFLGTAGGYFLGLVGGWYGGYVGYLAGTLIGGFLGGQLGLYLGDGTEWVYERFGSQAALMFDGAFAGGVLQTANVMTSQYQAIRSWF